MSGLDVLGELFLTAGSVCNISLSVVDAQHWMCLGSTRVLPVPLVDGFLFLVLQ